MENAALLRHPGVKLPIICLGVTFCNNLRNREGCTSPDSSSHSALEHLQQVQRPPLPEMSACPHSIHEAWCLKGSQPLTLPLSLSRDLPPFRLPAQPWRAVLSLAAPFLFSAKSLFPWILSLPPGRGLHPLWLGLQAPCWVALLGKLSRRREDDILQDGAGILAPVTYFP